DPRAEPARVERVGGREQERREPSAVRLADTAASGRRPCPDAGFLDHGRILGGTDEGAVRTPPLTKALRWVPVRLHRRLARTQPADTTKGGHTHGTHSQAPAAQCNR